MIYPFTLKPLPYAADALEPKIDKQTMEIHHGKHVQTYVDNLNKALAPYTQLHSLALPELLTKLDTLPTDIQTAVRNNGGGVYNHDLFFSVLRGGYDLSQETISQLKTAAMSVFGSGWVWLVTDNVTGNQEILATKNQDTPDLTRYTPILNIDVWEHSYYLKYQNRRLDYLDNVIALIGSPGWD